MKNMPNKGMSILDLLDVDFSFLQFKENPNEAEDYLRRGERIRSLAKKHLLELDKTILRFENAQKALFEMNFKNNQFSDKDCFMKIRAIARSYLRKMKENGDEAANAIKQLTGGKCVVRLEPSLNEWVGKISRKNSKADGDRIISVDVLSGGEVIYCGKGLKDTCVPLDKPTWLYSCEFLCEDVSNIIAYCALYSAIERVMQEKETDLYSIFMASLRDSHKDTDEYVKKKFFLFTVSLYGRWYYQDREMFFPKLEQLYSQGEINLRIVPKENVPTEYVRFLESFGVTIMDRNMPICTASDLADMWEAVRNETDDVRREERIREILSCPVEVSEDDFYIKGLPWTLWSYFCRTYGKLPSFEKVFLETAYYGGTRYSIRRFIVGQKYWREQVSWLFSAFKAIYYTQHEILLQYKDYKRSASDYALSYMDKANIPQKTLKAMEKSLLNQYFGFVEYDEDVDLDKVQIIEKEFQAVKDRFFSKIDGSKNAIRFRKLGHHKASGLYYPAMKCLCVDYRSPESFLHEYGHLIDHECNDLSLKGAFWKIRQLYEAYLHKQVEKNAEAKKKLSGKGKYNLGYFLKPTEIFARSFELFCVFGLDIHNDLLPEEFDEAVYPVKDEEYLNAVTAYFLEYLQIAKPEKTGGEEDVA